MLNEVIQHKNPEVINKKNKYMKRNIASSLCGNQIKTLIWVVPVEHSDLVLSQAGLQDVCGIRVGIYGEIIPPFPAAILLTDKINQVHGLLGKANNA